MVDVAGFGVFAPEKFSSRRQIIEEGTHFDLGARRFSGRPHGIYLTAIDDNLCPFQALREDGWTDRKRETLAILGSASPRNPRV